MKTAYRSLFLRLSMLYKLRFIRESLANGKMKKRGKIDLFHSSRHAHIYISSWPVFLFSGTLERYHNTKKVKVIAAQGFYFGGGEEFVHINFTKPVLFLVFLFPLFFYKILVLGLKLLVQSWNTQPCTLIKNKRVLTGHRHQCGFGALPRRNKLWMPSAGGRLARPSIEDASQQLWLGNKYLRLHIIAIFSISSVSKRKCLYLF